MDIPIKVTETSLGLQKGFFHLSCRDNFRYVTFYEKDIFHRFYLPFGIKTPLHAQFINWLREPVGRCQFNQMVFNTTILPDQTRHVEIQAWGNRGYLWSIFIEMTPQNVLDIIELIEAQGY